MKRKFCPSEHVIFFKISRSMRDSEVIILAVCCYFPNPLLERNCCEQEAMMKAPNGVWVRLQNKSPKWKFRGKD